MSKSLTAPVLSRILDPVGRALNVEAAEKLIGLKADAKARARMAKLARKCNDGTLTPEERSEYETYVMAGEFVAVLQAKARLILGSRTRPA
jgi:hypothetical protein